jgi:hypothetical protein
MMHVAIYDAVNNIVPTHQSYAVHLTGISPAASVDAAAASAAHDVLVGLYPGQKTSLDNELQQSLAPIPAGANRDAGAAVGSAVAAQILALRANDGANITPPPFVFGSGPGVFISPPPSFPAAAFTIWDQVTPFTLRAANQFRVGPPPALTSTAYANAVNEIEAIGVFQGTATTSDQMNTGWFWNGNIQDYWQEIAQTAALQWNLSTVDSARLFALVGLAQADTVIAFYDSKYTYQLWRPVLAIQHADTDNNPATTANPNWLPEVFNTPGDPSYPGAHAAVSSATAAVLATFFGTDQFSFSVTSEVFAGFERSFTSFSAARDEASLSRVYAGVHFRFDEDAGVQLGANVANLVLGNFLQ